MTKPYATLGFVALLALVGCQDGIDGNGERATETRPLSKFWKVRSNTELDVEITQGEQQRVEVSVDSNLIDLVQTRVEDQTLYVTTVYRMGDTLGGPHVRVTTPMLQSAKLSGSGSMSVSFDDPDEPVDLYLNGSGQLRFDGRSEALAAFLSGSGNMSLRGETDAVELNLDGSGAIHAHELTARSGTLVLDGSGELSADVSESASVRLNGSGRIELYGDAAIADYEVRGSGDFVHR